MTQSVRHTAERRRAMTLENLEQQDRISVRRDANDVVDVASEFWRLSGRQMKVLVWNVNGFVEFVIR